jgi:hypothetical protein
VIDVANRADVDVGLGSLEFLFCHFLLRKRSISIKLKFWCPLRESDPRPLPYQGSALPLSQKGKKLTIFMERETGIEPVSLAWKAKVLPLNYSRT